MESELVLNYVLISFISLVIICWSFETNHGIELKTVVLIVIALLWVLDIDIFEICKK